MVPRPALGTQFRSIFFSPHPLRSLHGGQSIKVRHLNPNVFVIQNFLKPSEVERFLAIADTHKASFKHSLVEIAKNQRVRDPSRTSSVLELPKLHNKDVFNVEMRAADLLGVEWDKIEPMQVVEYVNGQKYDLHHDSGEILPDGKVILTEPRSEFQCLCSVYYDANLNVCVLAGTATIFIYLTS